MTFDVVCEVWTSCCRPCGEVSRFTIIDSLNSNEDMIWMLKRKLLWSFDQCSLVAIISYNCDFNFFGKKSMTIKRSSISLKMKPPCWTQWRRRFQFLWNWRFVLNKMMMVKERESCKDFFLRSPYTMIPCVMRKLSWYGWIYSWWSMMWGRSSLPCWMIISY